ncbi:hypothetical protein GCM10011491_05620 [Brucella endophytica]|uniref:DUF3168 domain-containing protein n=1 Tax=Brucella endophytica TaxID=1963359 RepID=A0A916S2D0_9HYPH|nr:DUF3168 domain-containing protein [Brucella endophytica]GGA81200.1 hypothetical protein GCM10011491_05620 [Brucella endophytica]
MSADLAAQKAIRDRLISEPIVTALVPASHILDKNQRPIVDPCILIGEAQTVDQGDSIARTLNHIWFDLHVWKREPSTVGCKAIAGAVRAALRWRLDTADSRFHCVDNHVTSTRILRDPDGETSHGVVTVRIIVQEVA